MRASVVVVLIAILTIAVLAVFGQDRGRLLNPAEHNPAELPGTVMPVSVTNFPFDPEGFLQHSRPRVRNKIQDFLDNDVPLAYGESWESPVFDTADFTRTLLRVSARPGSETLNCSLYWRWDDTQEFFERGYINMGSGYGMVDHGVDGLEAKVVCSENSSSNTATIYDVRVLLRRE